MLNDEHELVRERSLVAIFRMSEKGSRKSAGQFARMEVFNPLTREEIFTVLMCLR